MRVGLHSGPVTAGVLRGDRYVQCLSFQFKTLFFSLNLIELSCFCYVLLRARFQLFGDTVNTGENLLSAGRKPSFHVLIKVSRIL